MTKQEGQPKPRRPLPERQCMGCNAKKPKPELLRVVRAPDGSVSLDFTGKKSGRGAYICRSVDCLRRACKTHRLARSLACEIPDEVFAAMEEELSRHADQ